MIEETWTGKLARRGVVVAPSLLASDFANLEREVRALESGGVEILHVDVMDGRLVPNISVGVPVVASIRKVTKLKLDVHLMIVEPERYIKAFADAGADSLTAHVEAVADPLALASEIRSLGVAPGLALNYGTSVEKIAPYARDFDILLTMSVPAGFGGQKFREDALDSVRVLRSLARDDALIEIDGGIDESTIGAAARAGANLLVAGTAVFKASDYGEQTRKLGRIASEAARD